MKKTIIYTTILIIILTVVIVIILQSQGLLTSQNTSIFYNVTTPILTIITCVVYVLTLWELRRTYNQNENNNTFNFLKDKLQNIKKELENKKFRSVDETDHVFGLNVYESSNLLNFDWVYYLNEKKLHEYFKTYDHVTRFVIPDEIPQELYSIMDSFTFTLLEIQQGFSEIDKLMVRLSEYNFNSIQQLEIDIIIDEIYKDFRFLYKYTINQKFTDYTIIYKNKEFTFKKNQIPDFFYDDTFKPSLDNKIMLKPIYQNYLNYINRKK